MADYWEAGYFKKTKTGKNFFIKCGSAKQNDNGGFTVYLDSYPLAGEFGVTLNINPPRDRGDNFSRGVRTDDTGPGDDSVPF